MKAHLYTISKARQYVFSIAAVLMVSAVCYVLSAFLGYKLVALILLLAVSVIAMFFSIFPVLTAACLSALTWDYFFIPPRFTLLISNAEDALMFAMYFIIAIINIMLTFKSRQWEKLARQEEEKSRTLKLYNTLLNSLSHELRTPIAAIIGATDNLKSEESRLLPEDRKELLKEISLASLKLNRHVENLLNMSRLESGVVKPVKDWCDVNELLYNVRNELAENASRHTLEVKVQENIQLCLIDSGLISQAVYNLAYNALSYTPAGSVIKLLASHQQSILKLVVKDNGRGFPKEEKEKVFERFYRLPSEHTGGLGLGLSIVKGFIEAQGGTICLEEAEGGGAKFIITIPAEFSALNYNTSV